MEKRMFTKNVLGNYDRDNEEIQEEKLYQYIANHL